MPAAGGRRAGVYTLTFVDPAGRRHVYVGASANLDARWDQHVASLRCVTSRLTVGSVDTAYRQFGLPAMRTVERVVPRDGDDLGELLAEAEYKWMLKYRRSKKVRLLNTQMIPYSRGRSGRSLQAAIDRFRVYCQMRGRLYTTELARLIDGFLTDRTSN